MLYFIAIVAPAEINNQVMVWKKYMEQHYGCKVALRSPAHITLVSPFSMKEENEEELSHYLKEFSSAEKNFLIRVKDFDSFKPRVIFLQIELNSALSELKNRLDQYLLNKF